MDDAPTAPLPPTQRLGPLILWTLVSLAVAAFVWIAVGPQNGPDGSLSVEWQTSTFETVEGGNAVVLSVRLSGPALSLIEIGLSYEGERAADLVGRPSVIVIEAGEREGSVRLTVADDDELQGPSSVIVLLEPLDGVTAPDPTATLVIQDDDDVAEPPAATSTTVVAPTTTQLPSATIAPALLDKGSVMDSATAITAAVELRSDRLTLVAVVFLTRQRETEVPEVTGAGLDWEVVATQTRQDGPRRLTIYRAVASETTSAQLEIDLKQTAELAHWIVLDIDGVPVGANGADAIQQVRGNAAGSTEFNAHVRMQPYASPTNATLGFFFAGVTGLESEPGYIEVAEQPFELRTLAAFFLPEPDEIVETAQWGQGAHWLAIALELQSAAD